jgi:hypothetical protein
VQEKLQVLNYRDLNLQNYHEKRLLDRKIVENCRFQSSECVKSDRLIDAVKQ